MKTEETNDYVMLGSFNLFNVLVMPYGFQALPLINRMTITITGSSEERIHFRRHIWSYLFMICNRIPWVSPCDVFQFGINSVYPSQIRGLPPIT
jgi:hypothetical protein